MAEKARTYQDVKLRQLDEVSTYRVYGRVVEFEERSAARRPWRLVSPCLCVHDSPDSPCPCPPLLWWLRSDMIVAEGKADRKDQDGNELQYFDVLVESKIMVETVSSVSAGALKRLGKNISPRAISDVADPPEGSPGAVTMAALPPFWAGVAGGIIANAIWDWLNSGGEATPEQIEKFKETGWPW